MNWNRRTAVNDKVNEWVQRISDGDVGKLIRMQFNSSGDPTVDGQK